MSSPQEKLKQELTKLWTGELAAVVSFWACFLVMKVWLTSAQAVLSVIYPLLTLSFILVQGSVYWWILLKRLSRPKFAGGHTGKIYRVLKMIDVLLLLSGLPVILINHTNTAVTVLAVFIWVFAIIEWINYYEIRLSYSYNPMILLGHIKNGTLKKSRLAREIAAG